MSLNEEIKDPGTEQAVTKELTEEQLSDVAGGGYYELAKFSSESDVVYLNLVGHEVEVSALFGTVRCLVKAQRAAEVEQTVYVSGMGGSGTVKYWRDEYYCEEMESHLYFKNGWKTRSEIQVRMV